MNLNDVSYANDVTYPLNCVNTHNILNLNANNYAKKYNILHILRKNFKNHVGKAEILNFPIAS